MASAATRKRPGSRPTDDGARAGSWGDEVLRVDPRQRARAQRISATRPHPDLDIVGADVPERFVPDADVADWIRETWIAADGALANEDHAHLLDARIGVLWTNVINSRQMRQVLGTAEIPQVMGGAWKRGRHEQQLRDWFHMVPDFVLTFFAPEVATLDDASFCALIEHELYHCAQAEDLFGAPKFSRDGRPIFAIRGHDSEEFTGVMRRWGLEATGRGTQELVAAALQPPAITRAQLDLACGTCRRAA